MSTPELHSRIKLFKQLKGNWSVGDKCDKCLIEVTCNGISMGKMRIILN